MPLLVEALEAADELPNVPLGLVEELSVASVELLPKALADPLDGDDPAPSADWNGAGRLLRSPDAVDPEGGFDPEIGVEPDAREPETAPDVVGRVPDIEPAPNELLAGGFDPADPLDPAEVDGSPSDPAF